MTKKLVSFIFIIALVATSVLMLNTGIAPLANISTKSNLGSQITNHESQSKSGPQSSVTSKISSVNDVKPAEVTFPNSNSNFTLNQAKYQPGQWVNTTGYLGYNGSLALNIKTPNVNDNPVFDPTKSANKTFFTDPTFQNTSLPDWENVNNGFINNQATGYLNLTYGGSGTDVLAYNQYHDINGTFNVQFNYRINSTSYENMTLQYFDGSAVQQISVNYTSSNTGFLLFNQNITLDTNDSSYPLALNFTLTGPSTWIISPIKINYQLAPLPYTDNKQHKGVLEDIWVHGVNNIQRDLIKIYYFINQSTTLNNNTYVSFNFTLPKTQLYIGQWQLSLLVYPKNNQNQTLTVLQKIFIPILVMYNLYFKMEKLYMYRGLYANDTPLYVDETNITNVFSPSDQIVYVGQLFTNVTKTNDTLDGSYFSAISGVLSSNTTLVNSGTYQWNNASFSRFNPATGFQNTTLYNLLPNSLKNNYTWVIQSSIPTRGIYGRVNQTLKLNFPSALTPYNSSLGVSYFNEVSANVTLNPAIVKFNVNVSTYNLPFNRTWIITEFMEGNFTVNTYRYNLSYLTQFNTTVNQTFPLQLNIPKTDLDFNVYLNDTTTGIIGQLLPTILLPNNKTFYFSGAISPNLNTQDLYQLGIRWNNPKYSLLPNAKPQYLNFTPNQPTLYNIKGTLSVALPLTLIQFRQGDNLQVKFNVTIDQLGGIPATGLKLNAVVENSTTLQPIKSFTPQIIEADGIFTVFLTLHYDTHLGIYNMHIFKNSTDTSLGSFQFQVIPHSINKQDVSTITPVLYSLFGSILGVIVILGFFALIMRFKK